jgi:3D (Asp-Asp-Asp) domain-containing protein
MGGTSSNATEGGGRVLGTFRNTYYDFPSESDFSGDTVALKNGSCKTIKDVARSFYEAVCVQGSGMLSSGSTVSFAKRDCACAPLCPRTEQHICFDQLDAKTYPWGRGATGRAITPLLSVAVDTDLVPLDTPIYIPEFDGIPRDASRSALHDGCFIAQDRGVRVKGEHVDVFTGQHELTTLWNTLVPSNRGVTIVLDSPRCARASATL